MSVEADRPYAKHDMIQQAKLSNFVACTITVFTLRTRIVTLPYRPVRGTNRVTGIEEQKYLRGIDPIKPLGTYTVLAIFGEHGFACLNDECNNGDGVCRPAPEEVD
jgi:hypothetical protein